MEHTEFNRSGTVETTVFSGKTDAQSAFRILPLSVSSRQWTVMKARDPLTKIWKYFVDKCLPFGASISCALFQRFSNALKFLAEKRLDAEGTVTNYLDNFLFIALLLSICNERIRGFIDLCAELGVPISHEKTVWASEFMIFLGLLLDGRHFTIAIPVEKKNKAVKLLKIMVDKRKATVKELQILCGYLNFLTKAIFQGRTFLRRMYSKYTKFVQIPTTQHWTHKLKTQVTALTKLKQHHHICLDAEFKVDCKVWLKFLTLSESYYIINCPMEDVINPMDGAQIIQFYSDARAAQNLGFGCDFGNNWFAYQWEPNFIKECEPSIEYLELYALVAGGMTWGPRLKDSKVIIFCDNSVVVQMINNNSSGCKRCMTLLRLVILTQMIYNTRVFVRYIKSKDNILAEALSQGQMECFRKAMPNMNERADEIHPEIWSLSKLWNVFKFSSIA